MFACLLLLVPLEPIEIRNSKDPVPSDEVSSWIIRTHVLIELKDGSLFAIGRNRRTSKLVAEFENGSWLIRYEDGLEPFADGGETRLHPPLKKSKDSLRKRLDPKDTGIIGAYEGE